MFDCGFNIQEYIAGLDTRIKSLGTASIKMEMSPPLTSYYKCNICGVKEVTLRSNLYHNISDIIADSCVINVSKICTTVYFVTSNGYNMIELCHNNERDEYRINDVSSFKQQMTNCGYNLTFVQAPVTKEDLFNLNLKYDMVSELFTIMKIVQDNIDVFYKELEEYF